MSALPNQLDDDCTGYACPCLATGQEPRADCVCGGTGIVAAPVIAPQRIPHAAHYGNGSGHDLEQWDVTTPAEIEALPRDAEYHSGYVQHGRQHWLYVRRAPLSPGKCPRCAP